MIMNLINMLILFMKQEQIAADISAPKLKLKEKHSSKIIEGEDEDTLSSVSSSSDEEEPKKENQEKAKEKESKR